MSYLKEFRQKLEALIIELPEDKRKEAVKFASDAVYESYKNGKGEAKPKPKDKTETEENEAVTTKA